MLQFAICQMVNIRQQRMYAIDSFYFNTSQCVPTIYPGAIVQDIILRYASMMSSSFKKVITLPNGLYVRGADTKSHDFGKILSFCKPIIVLLNILDPGPSLHMSANSANSYCPLDNASRSPFGMPLMYGESIISISLSSSMIFCVARACLARNAVTTLYKDYLNNARQQHSI